MSLAKDADDLPSEVDLAQLKEELSKHGVVMCPAPGCDQDFRSLWGLKYHLKQNNHENIPERKFKCEQCNLSFQSRITLRQHRTAKHGSSESGSQLSNPCSKDKGLFHFEPTSRGVKSNQDLLSNEPDLKTSYGQIDSVPSGSRHSGLQESSKICGEKDSCTDFTGAPKRKRGRPKKTVENVSANGEVADNPSCENPHLDASCLSQAVSVTKTLSSSKSEIKTSTDVVTLRRTSTRVKTPRKSFYEEVLEGERLCNTSRKRMLMREAVSAEKSDEGSEKGTPEKSAFKTTKKKGRKPKQKFNTPENDVNVGGTPVKKKRGRKRKDVTPDKINISDDNETNHDENCETKEKREGNDNKGNDSDHKDERSSHKPRKRGRKSQQYETESDDDESATKKKQGRTKPATCSEAVRLKKYLRYGQKLSCENEGCGAKFTTALGYLSHKKICGVKEEDREKFVCEECGKEYTSMPGLSYHLKAKHTQTEPVESDTVDNADKEVEDPEITQARRARRKAASRALSKVQQLVTDNVYEETKPVDADKLKRKYKIENSVLDQLLTTIKGRVISKEQEDKWTEKLETQPSIVCPCKGCSKSFPFVSSVKEHLETCEKAVSFKCLACSKTFAAQLVARNHVKFWHVGFTPVGKDKSDSSDTDFQMVSSGDSEQESNDIEIEEIEEDDSNMDEECDEEEEIFVWDDKRKKYKKKKSKQTRTFVRGFMKVDPFGEDDKDFFSATQKWRQEVHRHKELFPNFRPLLSHWSKVRPCEINQYLPEAVVSPQFTVKRKDEDQGNQQDVHVQLPLFGSTSKDNSSVYGDVTFNVGGPVWAMDWCPVPDSRKNAEQFLAISTHRSLDQVHSIHKTIYSKGLIQLWHVGQLNVDSASSGSKPTLSLGIAHNYGAIWDISWCPSGTWDLVSSKKIEGDDLPRLGVLAIACSDGLVRIISIPWPSELFSVLETEQADSTVIVHATPHAVLMPCALGVEYDGQCGQAWCVKWCPHSMHDKIATGFSDGTVAIWNLLTESVLLKESLDDERQTFRLSPFLHVVTNSSVVRDLAWCPQNPNIIVTGSYDRHHKLWNMKTVHTPITSLKRGIPLEIQWPLSYGNIVSCEDDCFQTSRCPNIVRNISFMGDNFTITSHNSLIWSTSVSDWCKLLASGDAAGEVEGVYLKKSDKKFSKFSIYRVCLEKHHHDLPHPGNENGNQDEECDTRNQEGECNDSLKENKVSVELDDETLPQSTKEVLEQHKLVFYDLNTLEFSGTLNKSDPEVKRLLKPDLMQCAPCDRLHNLQAIHKVRFSPNKQAFSWLASGGAAGLARLHLVKQVT